MIETNKTSEKQMKIMCAECFQELTTTFYEGLGHYVDECENCTVTQDDLEEAEEFAFNNGAEFGYSDGFENGKFEGMAEGYKEGYEKALNLVKDRVERMR